MIEARDRSQAICRWRAKGGRGETRDGRWHALDF
jgi:hypothetical protein